MKRLLLALLAASFFAAVTHAQTSANRTAANNGKTMFNSYCASCHGIDGRGKGPAAAELKTPPPDLTLLSQNNQGQFPDQRVTAVLRFGVSVPAHGSAQMPVWGPVLSWMAPNQARYSREETTRISSLISYLKTLQAR